MQPDGHGRAGRRAAGLPGRGADALETWLRTHPGVEIVCRDGSGAYGEAIRHALPDAVQVSDRWHLWKNLCDKTLAEVRSHSACWATVNPPRPAGVREQTTRERWQQIHDLLDKASAFGVHPPSRRCRTTTQASSSLGMAAKAAVADSTFG